MLMEAIHHVRENHGDDRTLWGKLFAQEKNLTTSAIARMNLFLHGASDFQVVRGDTLRQSAFFSEDNLATFDCVFANPPFSRKNGAKKSGRMIHTECASGGRSLADFLLKHPHDRGVVDRSSQLLSRLSPQFGAGAGKGRKNTGGRRELLRSPHIFGHQP